MIINTIYKEHKTLDTHTFTAVFWWRSKYILLLEIWKSRKSSFLVEYTQLDRKSIPFGTVVCTQQNVVGIGWNSTQMEYTYNCSFLTYARVAILLIQLRNQSYGYFTQILYIYFRKSRKSMFSVKYVDKLWHEIEIVCRVGGPPYFRQRKLHGIRRVHSRYTLITIISRALDDNKHNIQWTENSRHSYIHTSVLMAYKKYSPAGNSKIKKINVFSEIYR